MKDNEKLLISAIICVIIMLYPFYEIVIKYDISLLPGFVAVVNVFIFLLVLKWYEKKHPEEFNKR